MLDAANEPGASTRDIDTKGAPLRVFAARGVVVNSAFDIGLSGLGLLRGFVLAALLTRAAYGIWGVLVVSLGVLAQLKFVGISDKYVQQEEPDQELAFQRAFTVEMLANIATIVPLAAVLPVVALVYGHWSLIAPGAVLLTVMVAYGLQAPIWVAYRQMNFVRQRVLQAVEPVVGFTVAVALAVAGAGYWALALGLLAGAWAGAAVAVASSPYSLRWRYERGLLRPYISFSGPIFISTLCGVILANAATLATNLHLGIAGVGALALSANLTAFTTRVDDLVSGTLYPAICAIQHRVELLRESFVKVNRIALMWAVPFGCGVALFANDLVRFGIGERWHSAIVLLQILGVAAAVGHVGFNWDDYFRARANTMPIAVASVASTVTFLGVGLPLLFSYGLVGIGIGLAAQAVVHVAFRAWYLAQLFDGFGFMGHALRAFLPTLPGAGVVLVVRALEQPPGTRALAIINLLAYVVVVALATWLIERPLIREAMGYLLARRAPSASVRPA